MTKTVYTIGYAGRKVWELKEIAEELDATIFDVRIKPYSRNPSFQLNRLTSYLGNRYRWVRALGNVNYKGGPVRIRNLKAGLDEIEKHPRPVILMCVCKDESHCHRSLIADELRKRGYDVTSIQPEDPPVDQLTLFSL